MIMPHRQIQYDFHLHQTPVSSIIGSGRDFIFGRSEEEFDSFHGLRKADQPGGADWRVIFRNIQEKRKLKKEQEEKIKASENAEHNNNGNLHSSLQSGKIEVLDQQPDSASNQKFDRSGHERAFYHQKQDSNRFESDETWRAPELFSKNNNVRRDKSAYARHPIKKQEQQDPNSKEKQQPLNQEADQPQSGGITKADFMKQALPQDFGYNTDKIFLLLKTGYSVQWNRLPMHFLTTLTKFPNFGIYSDAASSMAGYEVMDILADLPDDVMQNQQLDIYRQQREQRREHALPHYKSFMFDSSQPASQQNNNLNVQAWIIDKFKVLPMLRHAWLTSPDLDWYIMIEDDTFVLADNIGKWLGTLNPNERYYLGSAVAGLNYIFAHGGSGVVLSRGLMEQAFGNSKTDEWLEEYAHRALDECCGDFLLAAYLKEKLDVDLNLGVSGKRFQGEPLTKVACNQHNWCTPITTFHHLKPRDMELLWEYERTRAYQTTNQRNKFVFASSPNPPLLLENPPITYADIYTDFIKPYIRPTRTDWDNNAKDIQFSWLDDFKVGLATIDDYGRDDSSADKPYMSVSKCRQACLEQEDCLMFRYDPYQKYCAISRSITLGSTSPGTKKRSGDNDLATTLEKFGVKAASRTAEQGMYSEWKLDRIEMMRTKQNCDPKAQKTIPDIDDGKEGWYWHARAKYKGEEMVS
jgi:hypothetical protein